MFDRLARLLVAPVAIAAALVLSGCDEQLAKHNKPIPPKLLAAMEAKNIDKSSPLLIRLFKQEAELELWKQDRNGEYQLLKTYPICRWSGELGPKIKEGDRQAPEGFYNITPAQMNPKSSYYLSFNMGYPNAFDKAHGRTGSELMVHGDCSSRGCYAMTDEQIGEIYAVGREAFFGGQRSFQVQAYPFHMTAQNLARHRNNPNMAFWKMLKEGSDLFELTRQEPKVDVCEKRYVFNAEVAGGFSPAFNPTGKCPSYRLNPEALQALREKQRKDDSQIAQLIARGIKPAPIKTGVDGGMHPIFASKLSSDKRPVDSDNLLSSAADQPAPGTIPDHVNPPKVLNAHGGGAIDVPATATVTTRAAYADPAPRPAEAAARVTPPARTMAATPPAATPAAPAATPGTRAAAASPFPPVPAARTAAPQEPPATTTTTVTAKPGPVLGAKPQPLGQLLIRPAEAKSDGVKSAVAKPAPAKPDVGKTTETRTTGTAASKPEAGRTLPGAQPAVSSNSFESRWSGM